MSAVLQLTSPKVTSSVVINMNASIEMAVVCS